MAKDSEVRKIMPLLQCLLIVGESGVP